jgi:nitrate/nitrite-specific signal transduction histidine kinase
LGGNFAKRRQGIILVTTVAIIVSLMSIIIISIMFYYYNNQILHQPVTAIASGVDKFGIREIYPTKSGGEEWL